jgi:Transposase DDE domain group 1
MLFLRQIDEGLGLSRSLARCFSDARNPLFIEHSVRELVAQRLLGLAAGYEDLNDHHLLRLDPLFAVAVGKEDPLGSERAPEDQGKALASPSTLNRLELGNNKNTCCHKISANHEAIEDNLLLMGVRCLPKHSLEVVIDLDTTDDPLHGHQEGRFFHGFYGCYCYLPLFAFVGSVPLWAQLRSSDGDVARGAVDALKKIVAAVRKRCRKARIILRADSGFCREELMAWCETQQPVVYYCLGLARNSRLRELIDEKFARVRESAILCGGVARGFTEFQYQTLKSWTCSRRVIAKAEVLQDKDNPRFIVTNLPAEGFEDQEQSPDRFCAQKCYENFYCARGDMENQIKQQYLDLEADRTSSHWMASNQLRLWLSAFALLLFQRLRTLALRGTELANATAGTIRQRLLKIGALVTVSTRRVYVRLASAFPLQNLFAQVHRALAGLVAEDG